MLLLDIAGLQQVSSETNQKLIQAETGRFAAKPFPLLGLRVVPVKVISYPFQTAV